MDFDDGMLDITFEKISKNCPTKFSLKQKDELLKNIQNIKHNDTERFNFEYIHEGTTFYLGLEAFKGDLSGADVIFWGSESFIIWLKSEHEKMCDELGI